MYSASRSSSAPRVWHRSCCTPWRTRARPAASSSSRRRCKSSAGRVARSRRLRPSRGHGHGAAPKPTPGYRRSQAESSTTGSAAGSSAQSHNLRARLSLGFRQSRRCSSCLVSWEETLYMLRRYILYTVLYKIIYFNVIFNRKRVSKKLYQHRSCGLFLYRQHWQADGRSFCGLPPLIMCIPPLLPPVW